MALMLTDADDAFLARLADALPEGAKVFDVEMNMGQMLVDDGTPVSRVTEGAK